MHAGGRLPRDGDRIRWVTDKDMPVELGVNIFNPNLKIFQELPTNIKWGVRRKRVWRWRKVMLGFRENMLTKEAKQPTQMWTSLLLTRLLIEIHTTVKAICMCSDIHKHSHILTHSEHDNSPPIHPITELDIFYWNKGLRKSRPWGFLLALKESLILWSLSTLRTFLSDVFTASPKQEPTGNATKMKGTWRK